MQFYTSQVAYCRKTFYLCINMIKRYITILTLTATTAFSAYSSSISDDDIMLNSKHNAQTVQLSAEERASVEVSGSAIVIHNEYGTNIFNIYSVTGQLIKSIQLTGNAVASIDVPKGFYVVKCNNDWARKIIVR